MVEYLDDIYKNVKKYEKKDSVHFTISLKEELERNIGDNKDVLMHYKICADTSTDNQLRNLFLTISTTVAALLSVYVNYNGRFAFLYFLSVLAFIAAIVLCGVILVDFIKSSKYTVIEAVLEEIDKEWDTKHLQGNMDQGEDHEE